MSKNLCRCLGHWQSSYALIWRASADKARYTRYHALPFSALDIRVPNRPHDYPKEPQTLGEHLRKRRYDLRLTRREVGRIFKVHPGVIMHWENDHNEPSGCYEGLIRQFLGYDLILKRHK